MSRLLDFFSQRFIYIGLLSVLSTNLVVVAGKQSFLDDLASLDLELNHGLAFLKNY